jgi:hypothetical protein
VPVLALKQVSSEEGQKRDVLALKEVFSEKGHEQRDDGTFVLEEGDGGVDPETGRMITRFVRNELT